ncbi:histone H3 [Fusarium sp. NRRL 25303]|nr:histone H3 [Fusarium sp. NRRL 25303]
MSLSRPQVAGKGPRKTTGRKSVPKISKRKTQKTSKRKAQKMSGRTRPKTADREYKNWEKMLKDAVIASNEPAIRLAPFTRLVREILQDETHWWPNPPTRVTSDCIKALLEASEAFLHQVFEGKVFEGVHLLCVHAGRKTILQRDMQMYYRVQRTMPSKANECLQNKIPYNSIERIPFFATNNAKVQAELADTPEQVAAENHKREMARLHDIENARVRKEQKKRAAAKERERQKGLKRARASMTKGWMNLDEIGVDSETEQQGTEETEQTEKTGDGD